MACATLKRSLELDPLQSPRPTKRPRFIPGSAPAPATSFASSSCATSTPFSQNFNISRQQPATSGDVQLHCRAEMRRLHRRRQLYFGDPQPIPTRPPSLFGSVATPPATLDIPLAPKHENSGKEKPLFTFQQVKLICERMVKEREEQLREVYEEALNTKLAEQYDAFVKFTHDHVQRHFETNSTAPSYLS